MAEPQKGQSIRWVTTAVMAVIAYFGWGFAAADYFQNQPGGPPKADF